MKTIQVICIKTNGQVVLEAITLEKDSTGLELPQSLFDCKQCGIKANGIGSRGPEFRKNGKVFVFYDHDNHRRINYIDGKTFDNTNCLASKHILSHIFLDDCIEEYQENYRSNFYLTKHDPSKGIDEKIDFSKEVSYETFEKHDTTIDCNDEDIEFIKKEIEQMKKPWYKKLIPIQVVDAFWSWIINK